MKMSTIAFRSSFLHSCWGRWQIFFDCLLYFLWNIFHLLLLSKVTSLQDQGGNEQKACAHSYALHLHFLWVVQA
jgi:hypothetical protein